MALRHFAAHHFRAWHYRARHFGERLVVSVSGGVRKRRRRYVLPNGLHVYAYADQIPAIIPWFGTPVPVRKRQKPKAHDKYIAGTQTAPVRSIRWEDVHARFRRIALVLLLADS